MLSSLLPLLALSASALAAPAAAAASPPSNPEFTIEFHTFTPNNSIIITRAYAIQNKTSGSPPSYSPPQVVIYSGSTSIASTPAYLTGNATNAALNFDLTRTPASNAPKGIYGLVVPPFVKNKAYQEQTVPAVKGKEVFSLTVAGDGRISQQGEVTQFYLCDDKINGRPAKVFKSGYGVVFQGRPLAPEGCVVTELYRGAKVGK